MVDIYGRRWGCPRQEQKVSLSSSLIDLFDFYLSYFIILFLVLFQMIVVAWAVEVAKFAAEVEVAARAEEVANEEVLAKTADVAVDVLVLAKVANATVNVVANGCRGPALDRRGTRMAQPQLWPPRPNVHGRRPRWKTRAAEVEVGDIHLLAAEVVAQPLTGTDRPAATMAVKAIHT